MSYRWLWIPGLPAVVANGGLAGFITGVPWMTVFFGALVWDLLVCVGWLIWTPIKLIAIRFQRSTPTPAVLPGTAPDAHARDTEGDPPVHLYRDLDTSASASGPKRSADAWRRPDAAREAQDVTGDHLEAARPDPIN
ncbi:hypothetical protein ACFWP7_31385 [Streptomyces sp. NPDC058470]|uniref:hypothetical protein n=1 Tax=Streptomyces sp. NPDC058470 TaxID=3346515 RepID=UPI00365F8519